jgi:hypothetical protein
MAIRLTKIVATLKILFARRAKLILNYAANF